MGQTQEQAKWRLTDTLTVPVTVLHVAGGQAQIRSASGVQWVAEAELEREEVGR